MVQEPNASVPMCVTPDGIVALANPVQPINALYSMCVTLVGICTHVSP